MNDRKLLKQALDALENISQFAVGEGDVCEIIAKRARLATTALRERLAQPEQQPVATVQCIKGITIDPITGNVGIGTPAQPEKEPVAWGVFDGPNLHDMFFAEEDAQDMARLKGVGSVVRPLTTPPAQPAQRTWVGLTKADINEIWKGEPMLLPWDMTRTLAIEQRLKEKNT
jgi:hypothetical protein